MTYRDWLQVPIDISSILYNTNLDQIDKKKFNLRDSGLISQPIGVSLQLGKDTLESINDIINTKENSVLNSKLMYYAFAVATDKNRSSGAVRSDPTFNRNVAVNNLRKNGFSFRGSRGVSYLKNMCAAKFAPSPEGNGIDCHRHYESFYCKCIPIIEDNDAIKPKLEGLPVIYTKDYSEITTDFLNRKYKEILETEYDFSRLFLSGYTEETQQRMKERSKFWCNKFGKPLFYDED